MIDEATIIERLRLVDPKSVDQSTSAKFVAAVDAVQQRIVSYKAGTSDSWTTQPVSDVVNSVCGTGLPSFHVVSEGTTTSRPPA